MIVLSGGDVVLPDRIQKGGSVILSDGKIAAIEVGSVDPSGAQIIDASDSFIVPGFIDVHVHGVDGHDTLDGGNVVSQIARALPRFGVTAFCPTTVACGPALRPSRAPAPRARFQRGSPRIRLHTVRRRGSSDLSRRPGRAERSR